ncbi:MAG: hypothetical protein ACK2T6_02620, partial [Anaerolineae bacterium]
SIAAASVVAKTSRDAAMIELASAWPGYAFDGHKGYGSSEHLRAVWVEGPTPQHRLTWAPIAEWAAWRAAVAAPSLRGLRIDRWPGPDT